MDHPVLLIHPDKKFCTDVVMCASKRGLSVTSASTEAQVKDAISAAIYDIVLFVPGLGTLSGESIIKAIDRTCQSTKLITIGNSIDHCHGVYRAVSTDVTPQELTDIIIADATPCPQPTSPTFQAWRYSYIPVVSQRYITVSPDTPTSPVETTSMSGEYNPIAALEMLTEDESTASKLLALSKDYQHRLPHELAGLKKKLMDVRDNPEDEKLILEARQITHNLCGTAGTLGFMEVSEIVARINDRIKALGHTGDDRTRQWRELMFLVDSAISAPERSTISPFQSAMSGNHPSIAAIGSDERFVLELNDAALPLKACVHAVNDDVSLKQILQSTDIDGIIIDLDSTYETAESITIKIRSLMNNRDFPIIVVASANTPELRSSSVLAGAHEFLTRPLRTDDVRDLVRITRNTLGAEIARLLVIDNDIYFKEHLATTLAPRKINIVQADQTDDILDMLELFTPDMLVLCAGTEERSGYPTERVVRNSSKWRNIPILYGVDSTDSALRMRCSTDGGRECIQKPCVEKEVLCRVTALVEQSRQDWELHNIDSLTGILNRKAFLKQLELRVSEARGFFRPLSLIAIRVSNLQEINERYGHNEGGMVLAALGELLSTHFRSVDTRGRWSGNRMIVALYNEDKDTASLLMQSFSAILKRSFKDRALASRCLPEVSIIVSSFPDEAGSILEQVNHVLHSKYI